MASSSQPSCRPLQENQNLAERGPVEAKLREELAAMTSKAAELESRVLGLEGSGEEAATRVLSMDKERGETAR